MTTRLLVDIERLTVLYLRDHAAVQALVNQRVSTELPSSPTWPLVTVLLLGGEEGEHGWLNTPTVQIDSWGQNTTPATGKVDALLLARTVYAAMKDMPGVRQGGVVTHVEALVLPQWQPDTEVEPARPRYRQDFRIYVRPSAA